MTPLIHGCCLCRKMSSLTNRHTFQLHLPIQTYFQPSWANYSISGHHYIVSLLIKADLQHTDFLKVTITSSSTQKKYIITRKLFENLLQIIQSVKWSDISYLHQLFPSVSVHLTRPQANKLQTKPTEITMMLEMAPLVTHAPL